MQIDAVHMNWVQSFSLLRHSGGEGIILLPSSLGVLSAYACAVISRLPDGESRQEAVGIPTKRTFPCLHSVPHTPEIVTSFAAGAANSSQ